jgi:hypothetical protein
MTLEGHSMLYGFMGGIIGYAAMTWFSLGFFWCRQRYVNWRTRRWLKKQ